jgi:uncharacterized protein
LTDHSSELHQQALAGQPLATRIIDAHCHLLGPSLRDVFVPESSPAQMVGVMDRYGIDVACISVLGAGDRNAETIAAAQAFPDRFYGFHLVNPRYPQAVVENLERSFAHPQMRGIGEVHPTSYHHDYPITGPNYRPAWEFAEARGLPVLIHSGPRSEAVRCRPADLGVVAADHPGMNVLVGHAGGYDSFDMLDEAIEVARRLDNVYLEICAMGRHYGALEYMVGKLGHQKIVYGSDAPFHDWSAEIAHVAFAKIPDEAKEAIFCGTMARLLGAEA